MRYFSCVAACFCLSILLSCTSARPPETAHQTGNWMEDIRADHPRLFVNADILPGIKACALGPEKELFDKIRERVDSRLDEPLEVEDYGGPASEAAFVYLVTGEQKYFESARGMLHKCLEFYDQGYQEKKAVSWYSFSRISALAAYDWIFSTLQDAERKEIGKAFLVAIERCQPTRERDSFALENWLGPISGFYSTPGLLWFSGLACYGEGIDDSTAAAWVQKGYGLFMELLKYRSGCAGDDGGTASAALNYALAAYPWAEFNFFHTFNSATGRNITDQWPYLAYLPGYLFWNWLPGGRYFGTGDSYHSTDRIPLGNMHMHLSQIIHFYRESKPREAAFARWIRDWVKRNDRGSFSWARFLISGSGNEVAPQGPPANLPLARHFENMGQIFFRSGYGDDDTYACLTTGGTTEMHKHFDHNNFTIYRNGFLALDTGTRPEPGQHLSHYYCRTVAHNCITIKMPGEEMPGYWGKPAPEEKPLPYPNDGGQLSREKAHSKVLAFETGDDFAYVASDASDAYNREKCELALRQFVFLPSDFFIVFDRVISTNPAFAKRWLLHTATEPVIKGRIFSAVQDGGRLFCRTLLPRKASIVKVGGPGKQFMAGGINWPLPENYSRPDTTQLLGQWRIEVKPAEPAREDMFLHLIQVVDRSLLTSMVGSELVESENEVGVKFSASGREWVVTFNKDGAAGGHIKLTEGAKVLVDRNFTDTVQQQTGLFGGI